MSNKRAREKEFDSFDCGEDGKHNGAAFVKISKNIGDARCIFFGKEPFARHKYS